MITKETKTEEILKLAHPCRCSRCENPCKYGSGAMSDGDMARIAQFLSISEDRLEREYLEGITKFNTKRLRPKTVKDKGKPYGRCIFYDRGCTIHEVKPIECRIAMGCKDYGEDLITWFNLNFFLNPQDPGSLREYMIYLKSGGKTLPGGEPENIAGPEQWRRALHYDDIRQDEDWDKRLGLK